jgi:hypothetical protein
VLEGEAGSNVVDQVGQDAVGERTDCLLRRPTRTCGGEEGGSERERERKRERRRRERRGGGRANIEYHE